MDDTMTCGKGLAASAPLPELMAELLATLTEVLNNHALAIDLGDANGDQEHEAYQALIAEFGPLAERLRAAARQMIGYHDLPVARHDEVAMADPRGVEVFEQFVRAEEALHELLTRRVAEDRQMLVAMVGSS
jgi:hypothetical protein